MIGRERGGRRNRDELLGRRTLHAVVRASSNPVVGATTKVLGCRTLERRGA
jgi:hypothetical protein